MKQSIIIKSILRLVLLLSCISTSGCIIAPHKTYFASEAEILLTGEGKPTPFRTITRNIDNVEDQVAITDTNGIAKFEELYEKELFLSLGKSVIATNYYLVTDTGYKHIGMYRNVCYGLNTDFGNSNMLVEGYDTADEVYSQDTILFLEYDLDSLYLISVE